MQIPKGMYVVYTLWCPVEYRTTGTIAEYGDARNGWIPFISGFGSPKRPDQHRKQPTNPHEAHIIQNLKNDGIQYRVTISLITPDIAKAKQRERLVIKIIGRSDLGTGPLTNKQGGGENGDYGPETRAKMSVAARIRSQTPDGKAALQAASDCRTMDTFAEQSATCNEQAQLPKRRAQLQAALDSRDSSSYVKQATSLSERWAQLDKAEQAEIIWVWLLWNDGPDDRV